MSPVTQQEELAEVAPHSEPPHVARAAVKREANKRSVSGVERQAHLEEGECGGERVAARLQRRLVDV